MLRYDKFLVVHIAKLFHRVIDAWVSKKIELGACIVGRHPFRQGAAETAAGMVYFSLCVSGDDMNIIQVGRLAVSRYYQ